jgi:hypothetical protein
MRAGKQYESRAGPPVRKKTRLEEPKMRLRLKPMMLALAGVFLLGSGPPLTSQTLSIAPPGKDTLSMLLSERAYTLLLEIQKEAVGLRDHADTLQAIARNEQHSWQSHAHHLDRIKLHINAVGERTAELQRIQPSVLPWQQQAITEVTSHAVQVAASTQAAIVQLNENRNSVYLPEYRDHVTTLADRSAHMKQAVDKFLAYQKTHQRMQQLERELELSGD